MSNETVEQDAPAGAASETVETQTDEKVFDAEYVRSLRQEAAKYRTQAKEMAEKAKAYDDYVESQKTEQQKMEEALRSLTAERDSLRSNLLRAQVASKKQLPPSLVERLRGESLEELEADADALLAELKGQFVEKVKPTPDQTGAGVVGEADAMTVENFIEMLAKRG